MKIRPATESEDAAALQRPRARASKQIVRFRIYLVLLAADLLCVCGSFALGSLVRFGSLEERGWLGIAAVTASVYVGTAINSAAYSLAVLRSPTTGIMRALGAAIFAFGALLLACYFLRVGRDVSRISVGVAIISCFVSLTLSRWGLAKAVRRATGNNFLRELVIVDGVAVDVPAGAVCIDAQARQLVPDMRDPTMLHRLAHELQGVDRVIIGCRPELNARWSALLKGANIRGEVLATEFDAVGAFGVDTLCGRTTLVVATGPLNIRNRAIKRTFDLSLAIPALLVLAPVLILVAAAVKLDSRGPVFFRQQRIGRGNALFEVYKFRSMRAESADLRGSNSTRRADDRITRVGRFIRRSSIDELPQLLNVLFGSMSLVGPRPHALGSLAGEELFWEVDERYWQRHALKPGITGLAQVRGFRGATHRRDDLVRRLQADLEYISGWSVWRDIAILLSTVRVIFHKNAY